MFSPTSPVKQAHLKQVAQDCFQVAFEYIQRQRLHALFLGSLFQCFVTLIFPHVQMELPVFLFVTIAFLLSLLGTTEVLASSF